jgi:hypothetical protein
MHSNLINPANPTIGAVDHSWSVPGFPTIGFQVTGTISTGSWTPQASIDGQTYADITCLNVSGLEVASITASGLYRCDVNGYQNFRLLAGGTLAGTGLAISSVASPTPLTTRLTVI